jgi:hypothetical protein
MPINNSEISGKLHTGIKKGKIANTTSKTDSAAAGAGWIIANIYDTESFKGENRIALLEAIAMFAALYKGDI